MIGLAANFRPFFMRVNPDAAVFTPQFNKMPVIGILAFSAFISTSVTCDGNEEGLASFAVRDSNTVQLAAARFGSAAVSETRLPLASHLR